MRILVVEDDRKVASFIQSGLEQEGHAVDVLHDGTDAGQQACADRLRRGRARPDAARPIGIPGAARHSRAQGRAARADPHREGFARRAGRRPRRRRRRLHGQAVRAGRAVGAASRAAAPRRAAREPRCASPTSRWTPSGARCGGRDRPIDLKPKEYALLEFLMRNSDRPVTRSLIIEHVWDIHFDSISNVVEVHINSLRNKIDRGFAVPLIHTVRGVGYMLSRTHRYAGTCHDAASFQTRLTLFCTVTFALLLTVLSLASYRLLAQQLDVDASADLTELTNGLHGYLRFEDGVPAIVFDEKDADQAAFVHAGHAVLPDLRRQRRPPARAVAGSRAARPAPRRRGKCRTFLDEPTTVRHPDGLRPLPNLEQRRLSPASGGRYLLQVGRVARSDGRGAQAVPRPAAVACRSEPVPHARCRAGGWLAGRWRRSTTLAAEARRVKIGTLDRRLPTRGTNDQLDEVAVAFNETLAHLEERRRRDEAVQLRAGARAAHAARGAARRDGAGAAAVAVRAASGATSAASQIEEIDKLTRMVESAAHAGARRVRRDSARARRGRPRRPGCNRHRAARAGRASQGSEPALRRPSAGHGHGRQRLAGAAAAQPARQRDQVHAAGRRHPRRRARARTITPGLTCRDTGAASRRRRSAYFRALLSRGSRPFVERRRRRARPQPGEMDRRPPSGPDRRPERTRKGLDVHDLAARLSSH